MFTSSKANSLTRMRAKPELVTIGNRQVINSGHWNDDIMANYIILHGKEKWLTIGELAKVAWGQNTITTKNRARKNISKLWSRLLVDHGRLMVVEYGNGPGRAQAVKIYNPNSEQERQALELKLRRMRGNKELSCAKYDLAMSLIEIGESQQGDAA